MITNELFKEFYIEGKRGPHGLTLEESLSFDELEENHDCFQWLFPDDTMSEEIKGFLLTNTRAALNLHLAVDQYLQYLGFDSLESSGTYTVPYLGKIHPEWFKDTRIYKVLRCLRLIRNRKVFYMYSLIRNRLLISEPLSHSLDQWRVTVFQKTFYFNELPDNLLEKVASEIGKTFPDCNIVNLTGEDTFLNETLLKCGEPIFLYSENDVFLESNRMFSFNDSGLGKILEELQKYRFSDFERS